jgi:hypothetical protein
MTMIMKSEPFGRWSKVEGDGCYKGRLVMRFFAIAVLTIARR